MPSKGYNAKMFIDGKEIPVESISIDFATGGDYTAIQWVQPGPMECAVTFDKLDWRALHAMEGMNDLHWLAAQSVEELAARIQGTWE